MGILDHDLHGRGRPGNGSWRKIRRLLTLSGELHKNRSIRKWKCAFAEGLGGGFVADDSPQLIEGRSFQGRSDQLPMPVSRRKGNSGRDFSSISRRLWRSESRSGKAPASARATHAKKCVVDSHGYCSSGCHTLSASITAWAKAWVLPGQVMSDATRNQAMLISAREFITASGELWVRRPIFAALRISWGNVPHAAFFW